MLQRHRGPCQYFIAEHTSMIVRGIVMAGKQLSASVSELGSGMMRHQAQSNGGKILYQNNSFLSLPWTA